jgi:2-isopropylmalate synthase
LRKALVKFFPQLEGIRLIDYKVRIIDTEITTVLKDVKQQNFNRQHKDLAKTLDAASEKFSGTAAKTRVLITSSDGQREWGTVGVSENIIEASLQALVDSMEYALLRK